MAVETELKFRIPARSLKALTKSQIAGGKVGERTESDLVSTYFDTGKHKLSVSNLKDVLGPYRHEGLSRYEEGLRQAGLPE